MAKRTHIDIAEDHGVTIPVIKKLSREGVNVYKFDDVTTALAKQNHRIKPGATATGGSTTTLDEMKSTLMNTKDIDTTKIIKEKAMAYKAILQAEEAEGLVIKLREVHDRETKIGVATKAAFDKLENDLPSACAGLGQIEITEIYRKLRREILTDLADLNSQFWKERKEKKES